jgi:hypothetical protein
MGYEHNALPEKVAQISSARSEKTRSRSARAELDDTSPKAAPICAHSETGAFPETACGRPSGLHSISVLRFATYIAVLIALVWSNTRLLC